MTVTPRSAPASAAQTDPLQPRSHRHQACQTGLPAQSAKGSHPAAVREEDQARQQSAVSVAPAAPADAHFESPADGMRLCQGQLRDASGPGQTQEGRNESFGRSQTAPTVQTTVQSQEAGPFQTASAKPGESSQAETPIWLRPVAPLPDAEQMPLPTSLRKANTSYLQQQQRQEEWHNRAHTMQAGLALTTMRPPCIAEAHLQQGFGRIVAPLDQQQLTQKLPPHSNVEFDNSESRPSITGVAAPVYVQPEEGEEAGRSSAADQMDVSQSGASQQRSDGQNRASDAHRAAMPTCELDEAHDQSESWPPLLAASSTGQARGVSVLEHSQQAQHSQHPQQAQHAQHPQQAQHVQQTQHAQGEEPLHQSISEAAQTGTCQQSNQTQQAADQPQCYGAEQHQHQPNSWHSNGSAEAGHSGIVPGEPVVSSREHAQHHLLNAAPLPWQHPGQAEVAELPQQQD